VAELNYTASGRTRDPPVLFLHGFMGSFSDWSDIIAALGGRFRCVAVDLPGHGASLGLPYPGSYTIEGAARSVIRLLDELGIARPAVVGYSMGGRLALYLALHHPERCRGLFLESASPGLEDAAERAARRDADEVRAARLESGDLEGFIQGWYRQPLFASLGSREDLLRRIIEARRGNDPKELAWSLRQMGTGNGPSLWGELPGLRAPALAVAGVLDEKYVGVARRMVEFNPQIRAAVIPGAGHNVRVEAPGAYIGLLKEILQSL
jgi:2-succinyl-6-hydroxy-2,4-cyclohexadiene-1-carboxylate synthase